MFFVIFSLRPPMLSQSALQATPLKDGTNETRKEEEQEMQIELVTSSSVEGNKELGLSRDQMVQVWDQLQQVSTFNITIITYSGKFWRELNLANC